MKTAQSFMIDNKARILLALVIGFNLSFPVIAISTTVEMVFYFVYIFTITAGILAFSDQIRTRSAGIVLGIAGFIMGAINALGVITILTSILWAAALVAMLYLLIVSLIRYIFDTHHITQDIIAVGITVYLLLGTIFIPIYTQLETIFPGSFSINANMIEISASTAWTRFLYFSYATLTTLGYGDITPASGFAQSLSAIEAVFGVLYLTIFMARLVSLYSDDGKAQDGHHHD